SLSSGAPDILWCRLNWCARFSPFLLKTMRLTFMASSFFCGEISCPFFGEHLCFWNSHFVHHQFFRVLHQFGGAARVKDGVGLIDDMFLHARRINAPAPTG